MKGQLDNHQGKLDTRQGQTESLTTPPEVNDVLTLLCVRVYKPHISHKRGQTCYSSGVAASPPPLSRYYSFHVNCLTHAFMFSLKVTKQIIFDSHTTLLLIRIRDNIAIH